MPLTLKGQEIMAAMRKQYGKRAEQVFYSMRNSGKITGVDPESSKRGIKHVRVTGKKKTK